MTPLDNLRDFLVDEGLVRQPDVAGPGPRPWLPPVWRHPREGAIGPGDAKQMERPDTAWDDGTVLSLFLAPGIALPAGAEERRITGVDCRIRAKSLPAIWDLAAALRDRLVGTLPGGKTDWIMAGLYVIQSTLWRDLQPIPISPDAGAYDFVISFLFETRIA